MRARDRDRDFRVNCAETLEVRLKENLDGGPNSAVWHARKVNAAVLRKGRHHFVDCTKRPGCAGTFVQDYYVVGSGKATVRLYLEAPQDRRPEKRFWFSVHNPHSRGEQPAAQPVSRSGGRTAS